MENSIKHKLHLFIRKYNLNLLVRGLLLSIFLLLGMYLVLSIGEYVFRFGQGTRTIIFWGFIAVLAGTFVYWIVRPLLKLWNIRHSINQSQAAAIIGQHFPTVRDKLINLLQLEEQYKTSQGNGLLAASISQKTEQLRPIPFQKAINITLANKKWIRLAAIPIILLLVTLIFQSSILTDGTKRLMAYDKDFPIPPPFDFVLQNKEMAAFQGEDFEIKLKTAGKAIPNEVYAVVNNQRVKMQADSVGHFSLQLQNLQANQSIYFTAAGFNSQAYALQVKSLPSLENFAVSLTYPAYTGRKAEKLNSTGQISCPEGTAIQWQITAKNTESAVLNTTLIKPNSQGQLTINQRATQNGEYTLKLKNRLGYSKDTVRLIVNVVPDAAPNIQVQATEDSSKLLQYYFIGTAGDDYKVQRVNFVYSYSQGEVKNKKGSISVPLSINAGNEVSFVHSLNLGAIGLLPGEEIKYYLEAWDNNGIRGPQVTRTIPQTLRRKTADEVRKDADKNSDAIKSSMAGAMKKANELKKQNKNLQDELNRSKSMQWQQENKIEDFLKEQEKLNKVLEKLKNNNDKLQEQNKDFMQPQDELQQREQKLNEALDKVKSPELEKLLEEIRKLMEQNAPKEQIQKRMEQLQRQNQEVFKNLEALKEQFKQLQLERILEDQIQQLEKLKQAQDELNKKTDKKSENNNKLAEEQKKLEDKLSEIRKELEKADELNQDLEKPMDVDMGKDEGQKAQDAMKKAEEELSKGKEKKAEGEQKEAKDQLQKMGEKMKASLQKAREQQMAEDYKTTRELLDNLIYASQEQELIFTELGKLKEYGPRFVKLNTEQMKVREKCALLEDSLRMLAKRQPMVSTFITQEINRINTNMDDALGHLKERNIRMASVEEQYVMTGLNNLAVMLMESMQDMQAQMNKGKGKGKGKAQGKGQGEGEGQGSGGKKGGEGNGKLSEGQKQLGEMMQKLQQGQGKEAGAGQGKEKGQGQGLSEGGGQGQQGGNGGSSGSGNGSQESDKSGTRIMNKEYAQIALMQEALRRKIAAMRQELLNQGNTDGARNLQKAEDLMNQNERELVNKTINKNTILRQKEIETRLLEHEKAERSQKQDDQRQSERPQDQKNEIPPSLQLKALEMQEQRELLRKTSPKMGKYYKQKTEEYLQIIQ